MQKKILIYNNLYRSELLYGLSISIDETEDYDAASTCTKVTINPKEISVSNLVYENTEKTYDGTKDTKDDFNIKTGDDTGIIGDDNVSITYTNAEYASANANNSVAINVTGLALTGDDANNYVLSSESGSVTGKINKALVNIPTSPEDKQYTGSKNIS